MCAARSNVIPNEFPECIGNDGGCAGTRPTKDANCPEDPDGFLADLEYLNTPSRELGVAFSGGGTRAATAAMGQIRALTESPWQFGPKEGRWIDRVKYISSVSGGTWFSVPYTFLPERFDDEAFLGRTLGPREMLAFDGPNGRFARAVDGAYSLERLFGRYFRVVGGEAFGRAVADIFLGPFDLNDQRKPFTVGRCTATYLRRHDNVPNRVGYFLPHRNRPYLIANATLLAKGRLAKYSGDRQIYPVEVTPLYAGIRRIFEYESQDKLSWSFGGGYIESQAFGLPTKNVPEFINGRALSQHEFRTYISRFTLSDMMGVSGAAPVETLAKSAIRPELVGFSSYPYSPVGSQTWQHREYVFGDGEHLDNLGVVALLARQIPKIIAFVNTLKPLCIRSSYRLTDPEPYWRECSTPADELMQDDQLDDLRGLFGWLSRKSNARVFEREDLATTLHGLRAEVQHGRPAVHCQTYDVCKTEPEPDGRIDESKLPAGCRRHGIRPYRPTICWVYLEPYWAWAKPFEDLAKKDSGVGKRARALMRRDHYPYKGFPHFATGLQERAQVIDLDAPAINALSHFTDSTLRAALPTIKDAFEQGVDAARGGP